jgi:8-oxo-dGTP pyrophosphatase MutT (NUDIX family)
MTKSQITRDEAFGVIPILPKHPTYHFLLIQHHAGHWGFPKGHAVAGESALQAACREFTEETGIAAYTLLDGVSFSEHYTFTRNGKKYEKTVLYYPVFVQAATVNHQADEIRDHAWVSYEQAIVRLTFDGARQILTDVHHYLATLPTQS